MTKLEKNEYLVRLVDQLHRDYKDGYLDKETFDNVYQCLRKQSLKDKEV